MKTYKQSLKDKKQQMFGFPLMREDFLVNSQRFHL